MITENRQLKVSKTARITLLQKSQQKNKKLLIVLHGYGQLSTYFSRKFENIHPDYDVLVPEALNRFYLKASAGRVGASWMTKEDRESDIADNLNYLHQIVQTYSVEYEHISLLGFSQGGATAARYCYAFNNAFEALILWGSVFPPDVSQEKLPDFTGEKYFVLGKEDEFFNEENQKEALNLQKNLGYFTVSFDGKHDIDIRVLNEILTKF
jgi:predicted esterase